MVGLVLHEWLATGARWLHVVCAMAWIGASFYFIALDLGLRRAPDLPEGAQGEEWQVHGGGFYHVTKYRVAPARLPAHLTWFKWESYATWLSGLGLLAIVYWHGAELWLIDPAKLALTPMQAVALSAGSLALGWVIYDALCRSALGLRPVALMLVLFGMLLAMGWGYDRVFTGRAALLHLGAFTATIMTGNVFRVIMPNQRIVVADLTAGRVPDPRFGQIAKLRSTHNNYLTLPVVFLMLSSHAPLVFASRYNWLIAGLVFLMGVSIRHFFNTKHAGRPWPWWSWGVTALLAAGCVALSVLGVQRAEAGPARADLAAVREIVAARCVMCHAAAPVWEGIAAPPRGLVLETDDQLRRASRAIAVQAGLTDAMPPANVTFVEPAERAVLRAWAAGGAT